MVIIFNILSGAAFAALLLCAAVIDCRKQVIPNIICALLLVPAIFRILAGFQTWYDALIGMLVAALPLLISAMVRPGSFGGGDVKLLGAAGLTLGPLGGFVMVMLACLFSLASPLLFHEKRKGGGYPFAPCIFGGGIIALILMI